eukprot:gene5732-6432_t
MQRETERQQTRCIPKKSEAIMEDHTEITIEKDVDPEVEAQGDVEDRDPDRIPVHTDTIVEAQADQEVLADHLLADVVMILTIRIDLIQNQFQDHNQDHSLLSVLHLLQKIMKKMDKKMMIIKKKMLFRVHGN